MLCHTIITMYHLLTKIMAKVRTKSTNRYCQSPRLDSYYKKEIIYTQS